MGKDTDDDDAMATARAKAAHERGVNVKMISTARPATAAVEMDASEALLKRDGKDVYKKSSAKKARYAMLFPGQLSATKEGKIGEMREMHTQSPVVYLDFAMGRMKLLGSIVRPTSTRYFTLNAKSKDRMNLEEWFDSVIVFPSWYWIGTREENPEEKPLPLPEALGDLAGAPETDWRASVTAETSGKTSKETTTTAMTTTATTTAKGANTATDAKENAANDANGGRRPRRQAATAARKKMYADDSDVEEESDDDDDGRVTSPVVIRGKVESFMPAPSPAKLPAVRPSVDAPSRPSASAQKKTKEPPAKRQKKEPVIVIDSEDDDDDEDSDRDDDDDDDDDDDEMELDDESEGESEESEDDDDDDSDFE